MKRALMTLACLIIAGMTFANHWTPITGTQYNMTMSGIILIDGVEQMGTTLEVGAFCGDECRGSMLPEFFPPSNQFVVALTVVSNQLSGEAITFRLYDHATGKELDLEGINNTTFVNNAIIGTMGDWYEFSFESSSPGGNHWTPITGTQYNMTMSGIILIDGVEQMGTTLEVGAFCGDECRGSMLPKFFPPSGQYVVALTVVSNQQSGEAITFRLYDHSTGQELDLESVNNTTFVNNAIIGTMGDWYEFSFVSSSPGGNHWTPITGAQYNMTMSGIILIDGVEQMGTTLEVGAFCGDECRGSMLPEFFPPSNQFVVTLTVVSNQQSGEAISFRLYDHSTGQELDLESINNTTFVNNAIIGTMGDWYEFSFVSPVQPTTYSLPITGYGTSAGGYYLIASPVSVNPANVEGMTNGEFDLYRFDQAEEDEWRNYKVEAFDLVPGTGYLYAHNTDVTLNFTGIPTYNGEPIKLNKIEGTPLSGWNLVGNPYGETAYFADGRDFYVMNADGSEIIQSEGNAIAPMQGAFVIADTNGEEITFTTSAPANSDGKIVMNVTNSRQSVVDRATIGLGEGRQLPKFMLNEQNTKLYIVQDGGDYAVVRSINQNSMPVSFHAAQNGTYTLKVNTNNVEMSYLHLIDNLTGNDIDLLNSPSYTFEARISDYPNRFRLEYATFANVEENGVESFAFFNGNEWTVYCDSESTLMVIDMMGRIISSQEINGNCHISTEGMTAGVYILNLNGMIQKIVVE